jgi:hypothetical protein
LENSELDGMLSSINRREIITSDTYTSDSNKIGVNLSPIDILNEDIYSQMGDFDLDNYIGDPRDQYNDSYKSLDNLRNYYFKKYSSPNDFVQFFRYIKMYDRSLFKQIKRMLPARANAIVGTSLESHILERPKYQWKELKLTSQSLSDTIDYNIDLNSDRHNYKNDVPLKYIADIDSINSDVYGNAEIDLYSMSGESINYGLSDDIYLLDRNFSSSVYPSLQAFISQSRQTQLKSRIKSVEYGIFTVNYHYTGAFVQENIPSGYFSISSSAKTRGMTFSSNAIDGTDCSKKIMGMETIPTDSRLIVKLYRIPTNKASKVRGNLVTTYQLSSANYIYGTTVYSNASASYLSGNEDFEDGDMIEFEVIRRTDEVSYFQEFDSTVIKSFYKGTVLSKFNSPDGQDPVQIFKSNPNKLVVNRQDSVGGSIKIE